MIFVYIDYDKEVWLDIRWRYDIERNFKLQNSEICHCLIIERRNIETRFFEVKIININ